MSDIDHIRNDITQLKVDAARREETLRRLEETTDSLEKSVKELVGLMNRGRGAIWSVMLIGGAIWAMLSAVIEKAIGKNVP